MEFRSDYERLAHYEAKMKYYGAKISAEELEGGATEKYDMKILEEVQKYLNAFPVSINANANLLVKELVDNLNLRILTRRSNDAEQLAKEARQAVASQRPPTMFSRLMNRPPAAPAAPAVPTKAPTAAPAVPVSVPTVAQTAQTAQRKPAYHYY